MWEKWRDWIFWPLVFAFGSAEVRHWIAARYRSGKMGGFREEEEALRANLGALLAYVDLDAAACEHRVVRFVDKADPYLSAFRLRATLERHVYADSLPTLGRPALILAAHRGNGWWALPLLKAQGQPAAMVATPPMKPAGWRDLMFWPYVLLRWREMNRLGGLPVIPTQGATRRIREGLQRGERIIALIDIPPVTAARCSPVQFFGRQAWMPRQAIDTAIEAGADLWMVFGDVDPHTLHQHVRFEKIDATRGADAAFSRYAEKLEKAIRDRPGSWHAWGHVQCFFTGPAVQD